jgi:hypothetical protein
MRKPAAVRHRKIRIRRTAHRLARISRINPRGAGALALAAKVDQEARAVPAKPLAADSAASGAVRAVRELPDAKALDKHKTAAGRTHKDKPDKRKINPPILKAKRDKAKEARDKMAQRRTDKGIRAASPPEDQAGEANLVAANSRGGAVQGRAGFSSFA